jgi:hypothetical protein
MSDVNGDNGNGPLPENGDDVPIAFLNDPETTRYFGRGFRTDNEMLWPVIVRVRPVREWPWFGLY